MLEIDSLREYALAKKGVTEGFPFDTTTLVLKVGGKMFLLISMEENPCSISVKTDPEWSATLRETHTQITGAYHMNKTHWNSVYCQGIPPELVRRLIDHSYELVLGGLPKKLRTELEQD